MSEIYHAVAGFRCVILCIIIAYRKLIIKKLHRHFYIILIKLPKGKIMGKIITKSFGRYLALSALWCGIDIGTDYFPYGRVNTGCCPVDNGVYLILRADELADKIIAVCGCQGESVKVKGEARETLYQFDSVS